MKVLLTCLNKKCFVSCHKFRQIFSLASHQSKRATWYNILQNSDNKPSLPPKVSPLNLRYKNPSDNKLFRIQAQGLLGLAVLSCSGLYCLAQPILKRKIPSNDRPPPKTISKKKKKGKSLLWKYKPRPYYRNVTPQLKLGDIRVSVYTTQLNSILRAFCWLLKLGIVFTSDHMKMAFTWLRANFAHLSANKVPIWDWLFTCGIY